MFKKYLFAFLVTLSISSFTDEGMWEPHQMQSLQKELRARGYKGNVSNVSDLFKHPMSAIVSLGGCSAAFISDEGLIGKKASHGCIRMLNQDVLELFNMIPAKTAVNIYL